MGVKVQVANQTDKEQKVRVQAVMTDPKGVDPAGETVPLVIPPRSTGEVDIPLVLSNVKPWSPDNPDLYTLSVEVWDAAGGSGQRFGPSAGQPFHEGRRPDGGNDGKGIGAQWVSVF
ncbi:hypothetical protein M5E88_05130 [Akkermansia muciniphila]|nr:hypothetical protein M5E88_05130 [Akkermansia muciniphila]